MLDFIAIPMGHMLKFIYDMLAFKNYGIAIILLTLIVKTLLLPLYIKQYHSTLKLSEIQPQMQEIQKRYKNDKEKLNEEMMKVYQENKVNPAWWLFAANDSDAHFIFTVLRNLTAVKIYGWKITRGDRAII